jgi:hypothetical protein
MKLNKIINGENYFQISNHYKGKGIGLFEDYPVVKAKNAKQAIIKFLEENKIEYKKIEYQTEPINLKVEPFYFEGEHKYKNGRNSWWKIS